MHDLIVSEFDLKHCKLRLDTFLSLQLQSSKNQVHQLIKNGLVKLNGNFCTKNGTMLKLNDRIKILSRNDLDQNLNTLNTQSIHEIAYHINPEDKRFQIPILYQDDDILVINKPAHLIIHPAPSVKEPTLVDWLSANAHILHTLGGEQRYGIIHRLDKQTSGALAIVKSPLAYSVLGEELKNRRMGRYYLAIIDSPLKSNLQVRCFMGRCLNNRLKMSKFHIQEGMNPPKGVRDSQSSFIKLALSDNQAFELVAVKLHTGRTHQIRTHLESISRHILGDTLYGYKPHAKTHFYQDRILLHAYLLYLNHPKTKQELVFKAPLAADMLQFLQTHFTKDLPNDCEDIMEVLQPHFLMHLFQSFP